MCTLHDPFIPSLAILDPIDFLSDFLWELESNLKSWYTGHLLAAWRPRDVVTGDRGARGFEGHHRRGTVSTAYSR